MDFWQATETYIEASPKRYERPMQTASVLGQRFVLGGVCPLPGGLLVDVFSKEENTNAVRMLKTTAFWQNGLAQDPNRYRSEAFWHTLQQPFALLPCQQQAAKRLGLNGMFFLQRFWFLQPAPCRCISFALDASAMLAPQTVLAKAQQGQTYTFVNPHQGSAHTLFIKPGAEDLLGLWCPIARQRLTP